MSDTLRILITGATGFLGSNVLKVLMQRPDIKLIAACRSRAKLAPEFKGGQTDKARGQPVGGAGQ